jgi:ribosome biogenesis GTPase / thiamine phosphate phosphatase
VSLLERLGWNQFFEEQRERLGRSELRFARVVEAQRGAWKVAGAFDGWAEISGRFRHQSASGADFPAVGDWVGVIDGIIHLRLDRKSTVSRAAAGRAVDEQVVAANVDTIFLVTAFGEVKSDLNPRRLERYLTMVWEAGAVPVVVLNKADLSADPESDAESLRARLPFVDVVTISALDEAGLKASATGTTTDVMTGRAMAGDGVDATGVAQPFRAAVDPRVVLARYLQPAQTVALLGSSGVGKSTIVNRLLGSEAQRVSDIGGDGRGRHTTTARQLVELPGGALLIDTPGMRELTPWADESAVESAFDDITTLAESCRFADCAHAGEPGCAVAEAVETGRLETDRLENYRRLLREAAFEERKRDKSAAAEHKRKWKQLHQAAKALYKARDR